ncbi:MAG: hypothetical protein ACLR6I_12595 [Waltera sp.]
MTNLLISSLRYYDKEGFSPESGEAVRDPPVQ